MFERITFTAAVFQTTQDQTAFREHTPLDQEKFGVSVILCISNFARTIRDKIRLKLSRSSLSHVLELLIANCYMRENVGGVSVTRN